MPLAFGPATPPKSAERPPLLASAASSSSIVLQAVGAEPRSPPDFLSAAAVDYQMDSPHVLPLSGPPRPSHVTRRLSHQRTFNGMAREAPVASMTREASMQSMAHGYAGGWYNMYAGGADEAYGSAELLECFDFRSVEPRVTHQLFVCGSGTFLSPYWIELSDFLVYDALSAALDASVASVVACLNHRLAAVHRRASDWPERLREVAELLEAVNQQQAASGGSVSPLAQPREPPVLVLARVASSACAPSRRGCASDEAPPSRLVLLIGSGDLRLPRSLPGGATLITPATLGEPETYDVLSDFRPLEVWDRRSSRHACQRLADLPRRALLGTSLQPKAWPMLAAASLGLLLLTEAALTTLTVSAFCVLPERLGECVATVACLPGAGLLSPLACTALLAQTLGLLHGVAKGHEKAHAAAASGAIVRKLRLGALWNFSSLPNATIALACCISIVVRDNRSFWRGLQLWLLPLALLLTKVLEAQAFVVLNAAAGFTATDWKMYVSLRRSAEKRRNNSGATSTPQRSPHSPPSPANPAQIPALVGEM